MSSINLKDSALSLKSILKTENLLLNSVNSQISVESVLDNILIQLNKADPRYKIIILTLIDEKEEILKFANSTQIKEIDSILKSSKIDFNKIKIPINYKNNKSILAINSDDSQITRNLDNVLSPTYSELESGALQEKAGLETNIIIPLLLHKKVIGTVIFMRTSYSQNLSKQEMDILSYFTNIIRLAIEKSSMQMQIQEQSNEIQVLRNDRDNFISILSDGLDDPISIAKNSLWMFKYSIKNKFTQRQEKFLHEIDSGLNRLQNIADNLMDISNIQQNKLKLNVEKTDIYDLVMLSINNFKDIAKDKNLELRIPDEIHKKILIDKEYTLKIINNLISNAVKYTNKGIIRVQIKGKDDLFKISVKDTGIGISQKDKDKIFTKFGRITQGLKTNKKDSNIGLDLYVSKKIVEEMGGEIGFKSKKGQGSEFWFTVKNYSKANRNTKKINKK